MHVRRLIGIRSKIVNRNPKPRPIHIEFDVFLAVDLNTFGPQHALVARKFGKALVFKADFLQPFALCFCRFFRAPVALGG